MMISSNPFLFSLLIRISSIGLPSTFTKALGLSLVKGYSLVPRPAARIIAFIEYWLSWIFLQKGLDFRLIIVVDVAAGNKREGNLAIETVKTDFSSFLATNARRKDGYFLLIEQLSCYLNVPFPNIEHALFGGNYFGTAKDFCFQAMLF